MSYYAKTEGNMLIIDGEALPVGERLLDFVYYDLKKLNRHLEWIYTLATGSKEIDGASLFAQIDKENCYLHFFAELLVDTLAENQWFKRQGFQQLCNQYPQEVAIIREQPQFRNVTYKTVGRPFLLGIFSLHALKLQGFLKAQLEFSKNSTGDSSLRGLSPMQRLFLYEQWRKSKGEQPLYFECDIYPTRLVMDKEISLPADGTLSEWAAILQKENPTIDRMTELPNGYALVRYEMMQMVMRDVQIKLCNNCERYFINIGRSDKEYCPRPIDGQEDKTCESVGALIKHRNKVKSSAIIQEYNTAYKRANSGKRIGNMTEKEFKAWSKAAREKRDLCLEGKLSRDEFVEWLNQDRIYRKRG